MKTLVLVGYLFRCSAPSVGVVFLALLTMINLGTLKVFSGFMKVVEAGFGDFGRVLLMGFPANAALAAPLSVLFGVYVAMTSLSKEHEIVAMRSLGFSLPRLCVLFAFIGAATGGLALFFEGWLSPYAFNEIEKVKYDLAKNSAKVIIRPNTVNRIGDYMIYAKSKQGDVYADVLVTDWEKGEERFAVYAVRGSFDFSTKHKSLMLEFFDGEYYRRDEASQSFESIRFEHLELPLRLEGLEFKFTESRFGNENYRLNDLHSRPVLSLNLEELALLAEGLRKKGETDDDFHSYRYEIYNRVNQGFVTFSFALIGFAFGIFHPRFPVRFGMLKLVLFLIVHYVLSVSLRVPVQEGVLHPSVFFLLPLAWSGLAWGVLLARNRDASRPFGFLFRQTPSPSPASANDS